MFDFLNQIHPYNRLSPYFTFIILLVLVFSVFLVAYAAQTVNNRETLDTDSPSVGAFIEDNETFGYRIENIGDINNDGVDDLAVIKFGDDNGAVTGTTTNAGSILILQMNSDGTVNTTTEILPNNVQSTGFRGNDQASAVCVAGNGDNVDASGLDQMAFLGSFDMDGDGTSRPTIAVSGSNHNHDADGGGAGGIVANSGAVYLLELAPDGTVEFCRLIVAEGAAGFDPDDSLYLEQAAAFFGFPVFATDVNGDGRNELIAGSGDTNDSRTALWVLFLNADGTVASHPGSKADPTHFPIRHNQDLGETVTRFLDHGATVDGGKKIVVSDYETSSDSNLNNGGNVFIVNLNSTGGYVSSSERITGVSLGGAADDLLGSGVTSLGDMDADGITDILVGNIGGDDSFGSSGEAYLLFLNSGDGVKESQKLSNESENTRLGAGTNPFGASDVFGNGMDLWIDSGSNAVIAISEQEDGTASGAIHLFYITRASAVTAENGGGGDSDGKHKTKPTFGIDHKTNLQKVDDGLTINGESFTVDDNFWTEIPMQHMKVGETQNFTAKVYAPKELHVMEFLFGIPEVGNWDKAEASVAFFFDHLGDLNQVDWKNKNKIINITSVSFTTDKVSCQSDDVVNDCRQVSVELKFNESPIGKVLGLQAIDHERRSNILYFNDGITLTGKSQNPPIIQQIKSEIKYKGLQTIQRIDKELDIWITLDDDEPVSKYQQNSFGTFIPIELKKTIISKDKLRTIIDKEHSEFYKLYEYEIKRAIKHFNSNEIQSTLNDSISSDTINSENYLVTLPKEHPEFYKIRAYEMNRALKQFNSNEIQADFENDFEYKHEIKSKKELEILRALDEYKKSSTDNEKNND